MADTTTIGWTDHTFLRLDGPFWDGCYSVVPADA